MDTLLRDLRFGIRMAFKHPALSLVVIVTFGLGIGLTTTVFSIVNGALFKGLPFENAERVMLIGRSDSITSDQGFPLVSALDVQDFREQQTVFDRLAAFATRPVSISEGEGRPERLTAGYFTANVLDVLRVRPILGRSFRAGEDQPGAEPVAIIGYEIWRDRFSTSRDVLGRTVRVNGETRTIVGVMPHRFGFPYHEQIWMPLVMDSPSGPRGQALQYTAFGPLTDGVTAGAARAQLLAIAARVAPQRSESGRGLTVTLQTVTEVVVGSAFTQLLLTMLGAVLGVLLIACANVANLLLAKASLRTREVAVRTALGASRGRVIGQLMVEVLVLAVAGGALGLVLGTEGIRWFNHTIASAPQPPFWMTFDLDHRVLLFTIGASVLAGVASSLVPAIQASQTDIVATLKDQGRGQSGLRMGRFSSWLVIGEVAVSCALLVASGLMIRSVIQLGAVDLPFETKNVFTARLDLPAIPYPDAAARARLREGLLPRLAAIPGVEAAALADGLPAYAGYATTAFEVEGRSYAVARDFPVARQGVVSPGFFETFKTKVLQGRAFTDLDRAGALPVTVVNASFARNSFPGGDALGRRIRVGARDTAAQWRTVVGVVGDMRMQGWGDNAASPAGFYVPMAQSDPGGTVSIVLRTRGAPMSKTADVRAAVATVDPDLPLSNVRSMVAAIERATWFYRVFGTLFTVFGLAALFLAVVGLYGVMSFSVTRRTQEMGIRLALGAQATQLVWLVVRRGVVQLAAGLGIGLALATAAAGPLQTVLFEVGARDPQVLGTVVATLALAGLAASIIPASRVTRVNPVVALSAE